jgi:hypothetical protein
MVKEATTRVPLEGVHVYAAGTDNDESAITKGP